MNGIEGTRAAINRFNEAFNRHDLDAVMAAMTSDCARGHGPPDGDRHVGADAVRRCWEKLFAGSPAAVFEAEDVIVAGDRAVVTWCYHWTQHGDGHVRGVDLFRVHEGLIAEKLSYVKGVTDMNRDLQGAAPTSSIRHAIPDDHCAAARRAPAGGCITWSTPWSPGNR